MLVSVFIALVMARYIFFMLKVLLNTNQPAYSLSRDMLLCSYCFSIYLFCRLLLKLLIKHNWTRQAFRR